MILLLQPLPVPSLMWSLGEFLVLHSTRRSLVTPTTLSRHIPERLFGAINGTDYMEAGQTIPKDKTFSKPDEYHNGTLFKQAIFNSNTWVKAGIWVKSTDTLSFNRVQWVAQFYADAPKIKEFFKTGATSIWTS
jgi:hypothetical protein